MAEDSVLPVSELDTTDDRRSADRYLTVFKPITFRLENVHGMMLLRNISAGGLMGHVYTQLPVGEQVVVELHPGLSVDGRIAWANEVDVGIAFDRPIDPRRVLEEMSRPRHKGLAHRAPRLTIERPARLRTGEFVDEVVALDVSQGGAKIAADFARVGEEVDLMIAGFGSHRARVVWSEFGCAGLQFYRSVDCIALAKWANTLEHMPPDS